MALPTINLTGNLTSDPELRFTASGRSYATTRVACSQRRKTETGEWVDGDTCFIDIVIWRGAEAAVENLKKGSTVMLSGHLKSRTYEKDGQQRTTYEVTADEIALVTKIKTPAESATDWNAPF
jgi:single-strand DNA-binding protein